MMLPLLTAEHRMLQQTLRQFAEKELAPGAADRDTTGAFAWDAFKSLGKIGGLGLMIPPEYGGSGGDTFSTQILMQELGRADAGMALSIGAHSFLCGYSLYRDGNEAQRQKYLPKLTSGEWVGCWGITEPGAGSDVAGITCQAKKEAGGWRLNGAKMFVTNAPIADVFIVLAISDADKPPIKGGASFFLVEKGTPGLSTGKPLDKMGMRASPTSEIIFEDCFIPDENLLGTEGCGFRHAMQTLDLERCGLGGIGLGLMEASLALAKGYACERKQFKVPIASFQGIQFKLADMASATETCRLHLWHTAWLREQGQPINVAAAMSKLYGGEAAIKVADTAIQILGGYGYIKEFAAERYLRDARLFTIGGGTSDIQRLIISREILR
ncbi:MAG: acyl-CoA dehydrogenase family protein [Candidatus Sericytochromatia bacterium]|nr:acyl-CoA dehydrogenase family protein [Candidatus Sericytochromatia bacterium]